MACLPASLLNAAPLFLPAPWWTSTGSPGVKRAASFCQLFTTEVGQTRRIGRLPLACQSRWVSARV